MIDSYECKNRGGCNRSDCGEGLVRQCKGGEAVYQAKCLCNCKKCKKQDRFIGAIKEKSVQLEDASYNGFNNYVLLSDIIDIMDS